jgi:hypothetical protein
MLVSSQKQQAVLNMRVGHKQVPYAQDVLVVTVLVTYTAPDRCGGTHKHGCML